MGTVSARTNLLGLTRPELEAFVSDLGERPFRARQLMNWIYRRGAGDIASMTDLGKVFRDRLAEVAEIVVPEVLHRQVSIDGTRKWLLRFEGGQAIEMVFIPEPGRGTLCISSQVGCAMDCTFCSTAQQGFNRNLTAAEIIGQLWLANRALGVHGQPGGVGAGNREVSNVVFMGMGEPMLNLDAVIPAARLMIDENGYGLSRRRVTVSTSGVVPGMERLAAECPVALAVSLHAPDDELRDRIVPINRKYPIKDLLAACNRYLEHAPRDFITFEYVMLDGVNDSDAHAKALLGIARKVRSKFNLIPFNPFPDSGFQRSSPERIRRFASILQRAGITVTTRKTRGDAIDAACGQLAGDVADRTRRTKTIPLRELRA